MWLASTLPAHGFQHCAEASRQAELRKVVDSVEVSQVPPLKNQRSVSAKVAIADDAALARPLPLTACCPSMAR